jgi:hypothetical protein
MNLVIKLSNGHASTSACSVWEGYPEHRRRDHLTGRCLYCFVRRLSIHADRDRLVDAYRPPRIVTTNPRRATVTSNTKARQSTINHPCRPEFVQVCNRYRWEQGAHLCASPPLSARKVAQGGTSLIYSLRRCTDYRPFLSYGMS